MIGTKLGHYDITAHLGSVGMAEVFQTIDTKSWGAVLRSSFFLTLGIGYRITRLFHFELARGWKTMFDFPMLRRRTRFDDPLFVRTNRGLTPTQRALELAGPLRERLAALEALLQKQPGFDSARAALALQRSTTCR
jgi:hypothetical protein